jgi:hypothetical protein
MKATIKDPRVLKAVAELEALIKAERNELKVRVLRHRLEDLRFLYLRRR